MIQRLCRGAARHRPGAPRTPLLANGVHPRAVGALRRGLPTAGRAIWLAALPPSASEPQEPSTAAPSGSGQHADSNGGAALGSGEAGGAAAAALQHGSGSGDAQGAPGSAPAPAVAAAPQKGLPHRWRLVWMMFAAFLLSNLDKVRRARVQLLREAGTPALPAQTARRAASRCMHQPRPPSQQARWPMQRCPPPSAPAARCSAAGQQGGAPLRPAVTSRWSNPAARSNPPQHRSTCRSQSSPWRATSAGARPTGGWCPAPSSGGERRGTAARQRGASCSCSCTALWLRHETPLAPTRCFAPSPAHPDCHSPLTHTPTTVAGTP